MKNIKVGIFAWLVVGLFTHASLASAGSILAAPVEVGVPVVESVPDGAMGSGGSAVELVGTVPYASLLSEEIDTLIDRVVDLNEEHGWHWSRAGSMIASLEEAFLMLDQGEVVAAARQLSHFRGQIHMYLARDQMSEMAGRPLLELAGKLIERLTLLKRSQRLETQVGRLHPL